MKLILLFLFLLTSIDLYSFEYEYVYRNNNDSTTNCYLKIYPTTDEIKGIVVRDFTNLPDMTRKSYYNFLELSSEAGYLTLITNTSKQYPELYTSDSVMQLLDEMIHEVLIAEQLPADNIFIGGISASGTRALRYAQYCNRGKSDIKPKGVFVVDSPLDLGRFHNSAIKHKDNFSGGMLTEANWMIPYFNKLFGGTPSDVPEKYINGSVFSHPDSLNYNASTLKNTSIILYHEPDIDWWIEERGASYYDINSFDIAAFTIFQKKIGNNDIELVTTSGKGYDKKGKRKPHSWSIVDEKYLLNWIIERTE